ncbi:G-type lectin S-receptor-like serine/threonine-protein kinase SD3-1 [Forsythia ovata]|uniref:Receptor-like serine/threonine-protein kinase n=1 Tax=Forsythia ovata TaxID=205694 RepID=A0ABD1RH54_9LAMI
MGVFWLKNLLCRMTFKKIPGKSSGLYCLKRFSAVLVVMLFLCYACSCGFCDTFNMVSVPLGFEVSGFDRNANWVSENGVFAFGFWEKDGDDVDGFVVGIRYNLGDKAANFPVWTVGEGLRVAKNSTFRLAMDGKLVLINNPNGIIVWSSNTSSLGVQKASLLDNGNLVLLGNKDEVIWESFSSPTNTLLPGQSLHYPLSLRGPSMRSISSYYSLVIRQSGELELVWEHNVTYWRSHFSSSAIVKEARFDSVGMLGLYDDGNKVVWSVSSKDFGDPSGTLRHLRIDQDGNLRIYSWDSVSSTWKVGWQALEDQCNVFGSCGLYSVCGYNSTGPVCDCLSLDSLQWRIGASAVDTGGSGCKKMVDLGNCKMHTSMFVMNQTVLYGLYPPHDVDMLLSEEACKEYCSSDTTCIAATSANDGSGLCTIKRTSFISGYRTPFVRSVSFLKVCSVPLAVAASGADLHSNAQSVALSSGGLNAEGGSVKKFIGAIVLIVLLTVSVLLSIQMSMFWFIYHRRKVKAQTRIPFGKDAQMNPHYSVLIRLSFEEIKELTNSFASPLGRSVFRGILPNKIPVVAKVLNDVVASEKDFRVAVSTLGGTHHRNLVSVKGFCFEPRQKILLYEYVPNGSLDKWLFNSEHEQQEQICHKRLDIALGVAHALSYLHSECQQCIPHGNLSLENVLLDENLVPKVTDFGLQGLLIKKGASSSESPSERDIYMLGQMFVQIVTCKNEVAGHNVQQILDQVYQEQKFMESDSLKMMERIVRIAFWCMQSKPFLRPSIGEVVKVLEGTLSVDRPPSSGLPQRHDSIIESEVVTEIEVE